MSSSVIAPGTLSGIQSKKFLTATLVIIVGVALRFLVARRGHNYDFESYLLVASGREEGLTPWQVGRYNYGPVWAYLLYGFRWVEATIGIGFRMQIIGLLTLADVMIAYFVLRSRGLITASIFFLNPISVIITGYHNQFDNLAIAIACAALLVNKDVTTGRICRSDLISIVLLSLSLSTKHVLLVFIGWMALRQASLLRKVTYLCLPPLLFFTSFTPFLSSSWSEIKLMVIGYDSGDNGQLWELLGLQNGIGPVSVMRLFVASLFFVGLLVRRKPLHESLFLYLVTIVAVTPSFANQYFAVAAIGAVGLLNSWFIPYLAIGTYSLLTSYHGLHFGSQSRLVGKIIPDDPMLTDILEFTFKIIPISLICGVVAYFALNRREATDAR